MKLVLIFKRILIAQHVVALLAGCSTTNLNAQITSNSSELKPILTGEVRKMSTEEIRAHINTSTGATSSRTDADLDGMNYGMAEFSIENRSDKRLYIPNLTSNVKICAVPDPSQPGNTENISVSFKTYTVSENVSVPFPDSYAIKPSSSGKFTFIYHDRQWGCSESVNLAVHIKMEYKLSESEQVGTLEKTIGSVD